MMTLRTILCLMLTAALLSGAALAAAEKLAASGARGNIVIVLPDRGDRYFSKGLYET